MTLFAFYCPEGCIPLLERRKPAGALLGAPALRFGALLTCGSSRAAPAAPGSLRQGPSGAGRSESGAAERTSKPDAIQPSPRPSSVAPWGYVEGHGAKAGVAGAGRRELSPPTPPEQQRRSVEGLAAETRCRSGTAARDLPVPQEGRGAGGGSRDWISPGVEVFLPAVLSAFSLCPRCLCPPCHGPATCPAGTSGGPGLLCCLKTSEMLVTRIKSDATEPPCHQPWPRAPAPTPLALPPGRTRLRASPSRTGS